MAESLLETLRGDKIIPDKNSIAVSHTHGNNSPESSNLGLAGGDDWSNALLNAGKPEYII